MSESNQPLVQFDRVRVDTAGTTVCAELSFRQAGSRVAICGPAGQALVDAALATGRIMRGTLRVDQIDLAAQKHHDSIYVAVANLVAPRDLSVAAYLICHALAAGLCRRKAKTAAIAALTDLGLERLASHCVDSLALEQRRCISLAAALVCRCTTVVAQTPLYRLDEAQSRPILTVLGKLAKRRNIIVTAQSADSRLPEYRLLMGAQHAVLTDRHHVVWQGNPRLLASQQQAVSVWLQGSVRALDQMKHKLRQDGFELETQRGWCQSEPSLTAIPTAISTQSSDVLQLAPTTSDKNADKIAISSTSERGAEQRAEQIAEHLCVVVTEQKTRGHVLKIAELCDVAVLRMTVVLTAAKSAVSGSGTEVTELTNATKHQGRGASGVCSGR